MSLLAGGARPLAGVRVDTKKLAGPLIYGITEMHTHIQWAGDATGVSIRSVLVEAHRDSPRFVNNPTV